MYKKNKLQKKVIHLEVYTKLSNITLKKTSCFMISPINFILDILYKTANNDKF